MPPAPTAVDAAAAYAGLTALPSRGALAAMFAPVPGRADLAGELEHHHLIRDRAEQDAALPAWEGSAVRALFAAQRTAQDGRTRRRDHRAASPTVLAATVRRERHQGTALVLVGAGEDFHGPARAPLAHDPPQRHHR